MYPMDFEEFLWAMHKKPLAEEIRKHYQTMERLDTFIHETILDLYRKYLTIGGMPEAIATYIEEENILDALEVQSAILAAYVADMAKYAEPAETTKIMGLF